jgi:hypothetical protein
MPIFNMYNAPSGSVWSYTYRDGREDFFVMLDGFTSLGHRRMLWMRGDRHMLEHVQLWSRLDCMATRVA